jgi:hypothetical protein
MKKDQSLAINDARSLKSSKAVHSALGVVLQYWMLPNLGWSAEIYKSMLPNIRCEIIDNRLRFASNLSNHDKEELRRDLQFQYERTFAHFDAQHLQLLKDHLNNKSPELLLNNLQVSKHVKQRLGNNDKNLLTDYETFS